MSDCIAIQPTGPLRASLRPPGSKSITNRALVCAALAQGPSTLSGALDSEDTRVMIAALRQLGIAVEHEPEAAMVRVDGCGGRLPVDAADLYVANSGTTVRFLTAMLAIGRGKFRLDGAARMRERPIQDLLDALRQLGANAATEQSSGCPPVVLCADGLPGGRAAVAGNISSQFLSGLLMAAPYAQAPVELVVEGELVSQPYIDMTLAVMKSFGISIGVEMPCRFQIAAPQCYRGQSYAIEPDASAASYFFAAAAITQGEITVEGLGAASIQGDIAFCDCLRQMGCEIDVREDRITVRGRPLHGITVNMNAISDTVQTLGAVALFAEGATVINGVSHIRHKETDRIHALAVELRKFGATVDERDDGLTIAPGVLTAPTRFAATASSHAAASGVAATNKSAAINKSLGEIAIDTYDDHRMAMSMALVGLKTPGVCIRDPGCTAKTYPRFFEDLESLR
jgi:3-phosphoshikimate 1-carboxyvinyltransferase